MKKNWKIILIIIVILGVIAYNLFDKEKTLDKELENETTNTYTNERLVIEIKGEVNRPGLYIVEEDYRLIDVINLASGFTNNADTSDLNLASKITDGMLIVVKSKNVTNNENKISINNATVDELKKIPGIGDSKAKSIVEYRQKNGNFKSIEEIVKVNGISETIFEQIKEYICL